jgi:hypothetical protein
VAEKYIRFHYTFSHGVLWLKSIPDLTIGFSHGGLWLKSIPDLTILFSHGGLWLKSIPDLTTLFSHGVLWLKVYQISLFFLAMRSVAKKYIRFQYTF